MDDLISRQAAIKAICEDGTWLERQGCVDITMAERKQRDVDILEVLPTSQPEILAYGEGELNVPGANWIPVIERLPVEGESVLLCNSYGDMTLGRLVRTNEGCNWDIYAWWCDIYDWVAWMPLPKPYREVSE